MDGSYAGFQRRAVVYSLSYSGFLRTFKDDEQYTALRFFFI